MNQEKILDAIRGERRFQEDLVEDPSRPDMVDELGMAGTLLAMEQCLHKAREIWYRDSDPYEDTMEYLRKIAAVVQCPNNGVMDIDLGPFLLFKPEKLTE